MTAAHASDHPWYLGHMGALNLARPKNGQMSVADFDVGNSAMALLRAGSNL